MVISDVFFQVNKAVGEQAYAVRYFIHGSGTSEDHLVDNPNWCDGGAGCFGAVTRTLLGRVEVLSIDERGSGDIATYGTVKTLEN